MYEITSSYEVRLVGVNRMLYKTNHIYQDAVAFLAACVDEMWDDVSAVRGSKERMTFVERMTHDAGSRRATYRFDDAFPCMPCYMRRSAINDALGIVSSYRTRYAAWEKAGSHGRPPKIVCRTSKAPVFYRGNTYKQPDDTIAMLKLYDGKSWVWVTVNLRRQDVKYINKHWNHAKQSAPRLEIRRGRARLVFAFTESVILSDEANVVVGCDLGINSDAVLSAMRPDGTVFARKFINFADEKDRLHHLMGIASGLQRKSGSDAAKRVWEYISILNKRLADLIASAITDFAHSVYADVIVFEHLDMKGHGSRSQKIALWRKNDIQKRTMHKAHRYGMRIARVCAWNTSKLAYDGSGEVTRDKDNYSLCTFTTGKRYNCDLSASYNIAARYFLRLLIEPLPATARSYIEAKVPGCMVRTTRTLSTLINCNAALKEFAPSEAESQLYAYT